MNSAITKPVNEIINILLEKVQPILDNNLIGLYIGGSIANNSFVPETSDIDCYIFIENSLTNEAINSIKEIHDKLYLANFPFIDKLEVSYLTLEDLNHFNSKKTRPYFNEGKFYIAQYGFNYIIEIYLLREKNIIIMGPNPKEIIKEISNSKLLEAIKANLNDYWKQFLYDDYKLNRSDYQIFAIVTMCRTLYSLVTKQITSKPMAIEWGLENIDIKWRNLIEIAAKWNPTKVVNKPNEVKEFIKYTISKALSNE
ncbi:MAG: Streptomycin 3-adenylyltransferase [Rickettsiaceae bacterium]|jgi:hypothetical protein|nr:Streptomycin 3-adenylyltransferase [Rickettsiaceae bacterium]